MAKTRELKRRIRSVGKTRQITRTMEMVATSKLKRATDRVYAARPYAEQLRAVIGRLIAPELRERFPLLRRPQQVRRAAVVLLTSNRGLAGAFNANLIREASRLVARLDAEGAHVDLHVVGKKGVSFFRFRGQTPASAHTDLTDRPGLDDAAALVEPLRDAFERGDVDRVDVVYAQFRSALSTPPAVLRVLPIDAPEDGPQGDGGTRREANYILSPSADAILDRLLPLYVRNSVYRAMVETAAAEQGARRSAMKSATDNAGDMLDTLTRNFNRARQAQITQEIAEIVGGAAALE